MSNTLNVGGAVRLVAGSTSIAFNLVDNYTTTGSHFVNAAQTVASGSWSVIDQVDNGNNRFNFFVNTDLTSSVYVAVNSTASYAALLGPGDVAMLPNSGSAVLYAKATLNSVVLSYLCLEA